ncbi:NAD(P)H-dependent oxidoreductase [Geomonas sp. Red32]|uniref:FMN-dependent NADH-azoreductase n=1 Tax=Geomonas sp. Red32 TaxID=2912856 RepID=UPI00202CB4AD|nr:NAD(P)H-dependent oxidoreductase [Geomonas sp. Red32]MCM0080286.1 NAD(P)H-dependent oxidoreductase [Geomonas sp. Red32]
MWLEERLTSNGTTATTAATEDDEMASLLYITCNLKPVEQSNSLTVGKAFLDGYLRRNPEDEVRILDLYRDNIQRFDADVLSGVAKLRSGQKFVALAEEEQRKLGRIYRLADQFIAADKYVFVTPMWNLSFPAEFKMYIDAICVYGKTLRDTATGPEGLLKGKGKKCLHIHASGGFHFGKEEDHSVPYLKAVMEVMGVEQFEAIVLEGGGLPTEQGAELKREAVRKALETAARF